jgi:hypothetical protein
MAVTSHVYPTAVKNIGLKNISLTADSFKVGLCTGSAATWGGTQEAYVFVSDVTGAYTEVSTGGGYTSGYAGRVALAGLTYTASANVVTWSCTSPISFGATTTIAAASMFIYDATANGSSSDSNSWVIAIVDFGGTVTSTAGAFTYTVSGSGLATWTEN